MPAQKVEANRLYLKLPSENGKAYARVKAVLNMFVGKTPVVLYFADSGLRRQTHCALEEDLLQELTEILEKKNVVLK